MRWIFPHEFNPSSLVRDAAVARLMADAGKTQIKSQLNSDVWNHFGFKTTKDKEDKIKVVCKICQAELSYCRITTNLRNHLTRYHTTLTLASDNKPSGENKKKLRE